MGEDNEFNCIKIVVVGDAGCGKSSLIQRFISDSFPEIYVPTGFEKYTVGFEVGGHRFSAAIWDTSGALAYDTVRPLSYQNADVFLICFHLGDWHSLQNAINKWRPEVQKNSSPSTPVILCGCQSDQRFIKESPDQMSLYSIATTKKRRPVFTEEALAASRQIGAVTYVETSSLYNNRTAQEAFEVSALAANGRLNNNSGLKNKSLASSTASSTSTTTLSIKQRSMFKMRKCKSKSEFRSSHKEAKKCLIM